MSISTKKSGRRVLANGQNHDVPDVLSKDQEAHFRWIRDNLYVPAVCDILDSLGFRQQAMHQRVRPLDPANCIIVGRARTFRWMETDYVVEEDPYGLEIEAMDSLRKGDVAVHSTDASLTNAPWGELMSTVASHNGAVGCICDGLIRDCQKIAKLGFPIFHAGVKPVDSKGRGRVMTYDVPVRCGDVLVNPGELIFADFDGVVVIPRQIENKAIELAAEKVGKENASRRELLKGRTLREVFDKFGVL
ncbi:MAG TPA: RraA family protein [Candidatus Saccharimonadales bacterium]|nr:RraA family protein [Candidatus Saccharimonadales bacterium]